jgi:hypothetical protein
MASTGNVFPGTGSSVARSTATAWTTPTNIGSDNASDATCNSGASGSAYLVASNFNFASIPSDATVLGFTVRVEASEHSAGTETLNAQLQGSTAALVGSSKTANISGTGKTVYTYGGAADVWGTSLTVAEIQDSDFGVRLWFTTAHDVRIDYVTVAVEYSTEINEPLTGSAVTMAIGTLIPTPEVLPLGIEIASATGAVGAPETRGQEIVSALQTLSEFVVSVALAGSQIVGSQGAISPNLDGAVPLVGTEVVVSAGTVGPDYTRALTGEAVAVSAGSVTYVLNPVFTGQEITTGTGTVVAEGAGGVTVHISGVEAEFVLGSIISSGSGLTGSDSTSAAGTATPNVDVAVTGQSITSAHGVVSSGIDADDTYILSSSGSVSALTISVALEGDQVDCSAGTVTATGDAFGTLTGSAATPAAGTAAPNVDVALSGSAITGSLGVFGAPGGASLTGSEVAVTAGNVFLDGDRTFALTGEQMTVGQGNAVTSYLAFATGELLTLTQQTIGPFAVALTGEAITVGQGVVTAPAADPATVAGRGKKKGHDRRYMTVIVGDDEYQVESEDQALQVIEAYKAKAELRAQEEVERAQTKPVSKRVIRVVKHKLKAPEIQVKGDDVAAVRAEAEKAIQAISQTYQDALRSIEGAKKPDDDEADAIAILLG